MSRRKKNTTLGISGSAVDLLSCGLAAAAVLWILILPNSGKTGSGEVDRVNGMLRLSQFGNPHLHEFATFEVTNSVNATFSIRSNGSIKRESGVADPSDGNYQVVTKDSDTPAGEVIISTKNSKNFAAETVILFRNVKPNTKVRYQFYTCRDDLRPHAISKLSIDRRGSTNELLFWQEHNDLNDALVNLGADLTTDSFNWYENLASILASSPSSFLAENAPLTSLYTWDKNKHSGDGTIALDIEATDSGLIRTTIVDPSIRGGKGVKFTSASDRIDLWGKLNTWCKKYYVGTRGSCL